MQFTVSLLPNTYRPLSGATIAVTMVTMTASALLTEAKRLLGVDPQAARRLAEQASRAAPSSEAILLLAVARRRCGDSLGALALLTPLAARLPRAWGVHCELGLAQAMIGRIDAANAALAHATTLNPGALLANHALRDLAMIAGVSRIDQRLAATLSSPALQARITGFLRGDAAAQAALRTGFGLDAGDVAAACVIAEVGMAAGLYDAAARVLGAALVNAPGYLPASLRRAEALYRAGEDGPALVEIDRVVAAAPDLVAAIALRAAILMNLAREADAADLLARATRLAPDDARIWQSYGHTLRALGQRDEAVAAYRTAIRLVPAFAEAYWSLADLKTGAITAEDIRDMKRLVSGTEPDAESRSYLHFALGRAHEERGDHERAFADYLRANALRRLSVSHDADAHDAFIDRTIATFDRPFLDARKGVGHAARGPIFVLGMPRSGSSLVEQILASHPLVEGASELPDLTAIARAIAQHMPAGLSYPDGLASLPGLDFAALGTDYISRTQRRRHKDRPYFVDKFPGNVLHLGLIHLMLPGARIIDARRDARDCCMSLFSQSFAGGQGYSYDLGDLGRYHAAYVRLMRHFDAVLAGRVLRVEYEMLVDDAEGQTRRLLDHCGLPFDPACLSFFETSRAVRTASSEQVRQPIYRGSVGRWRRFEPWLGPLFAGLQGRSEDDAVTAG